LHCYLRPQFLEESNFIQEWRTAAASSSGSPPKSQIRGDDCDCPQLISSPLLHTSYLSSFPQLPFSWLTLVVPQKQRLFFSPRI
jgi:hypothetical protein